MNRESAKDYQEAAARSALRAEVPSFIRDAVLTGLLIFALSGAAVIIVYQSAVASKKQEALDRLRPQAEYLASLVDLRAHAWLVQPEQTNSQPHLALTKRLQNMRQYYPSISKLFTGRYQNGKILIILDTLAPSSGGGLRSVATPLEVNLGPDSPDLAAIQSRQVFLTDHPAFAGNTSHFLGVIVPLANPDPSVRDFLYLDSDYEAVASGLAMARQARDIFLVTAALFALIAGMTVFSWRYQSRFRQLVAVTQLRDGEELFRSTYEMSPVAMLITRTDGRLIRANKAFCDFLGYAEEKLLSLQPVDYTHPEDLKKDQPLLESLQTHEAAKYQIERRYLRADGKTVWGLVSVAIVRDSDANISHYMTQVVEITQRKQAEKTLLLSEERLTLAADAGQVGMWDSDLQSGQVVWNDVMHSIHGTDSIHFIPTNDSQSEFVHAEDRARMISEFNRCVEQGTPYQLEYRITRQDDQIRHLKSSAIIFHDDAGRPLRAVGTSIDITKEKAESEDLIRAKEAALAADKAKSEFLAVMSHEIRTPLNGVLGFVSMLKNTPLDEEQAGFIETMELSGQGLLALVNDILDLSKIESREIHVEPTTFEVRPFIRRLHKQLSAQADPNLHFEYFVEYSVPKTIHTDPNRMGQILTNLLGNALKFTESGRVEIHVNAKPIGLYQKNWDWEFSVQDTGPGIPKEDQENLFKLFYQVDSSATRRHGGSGLGLAISQRIAQLLGGDLTVDSQVGEGSTFTLTLTAPRGQTGASAADLLPTASPLKESSHEILGKRVLVVEDNPVNRKLCALQLKRLGCETDFAESGLEALEKVRHGQFDVILMDMQLPDLDGCGATREIRREEKAGERTSIIALTANAMPEDRKKCLEAGMDDFLSKPLKYETLASTISKWV